MTENLKKIADYYGIENQEKQLIEEMSELNIAIIKEWRYYNRYLHKKTTPEKLRDNMIEEMADVKLVLNQIIYLMSAEKEVRDIMEQKIERQIHRITPVQERGIQDETD